MIEIFDHEANETKITGYETSNPPETSHPVMFLRRVADDAWLKLTDGLQLCAAKK